MFNLKGKVALITGSARGIGKSIALGFAKQGADIVINDLNAQEASKTVEEIKKAIQEAEASCVNEVLDVGGGKVDVLVMDVYPKRSVKKALKELGIVCIISLLIMIVVMLLDNGWGLIITTLLK